MAPSTIFSVDSSNRKNGPLVTDEPVEFEKEPVEVKDLEKIADHLGGIYGIYLE